MRRTTAPPWSLVPRPVRGAFTLIELLVVVAIISLLMSILTPSLSRARQQAKGTVCLTRLREFMNAIQAYSVDHHYQLPPRAYLARDPDASPGEPTALHGWAEALYQDLYQDDDYSYTDLYPVQRNQNGRYELWECAEARPRTDSSGHYRVYEYSWMQGSLDHVRAKMPLIMDANPLVTECPDKLRPDIPMERIAGLEGEAYIDERHYGGANFVFNDGHAIRSTTLKEELAEDWDLDPDTLNEDTIVPPPPTLDP